MLSLQWTPELIVVLSASALVLALISFLVAKTIFARKNAELATQLMNERTALGQLHAQHQQLQTTLKQQELAAHQQELTQSRLHAQLQHAEQNEKRIISEASEQKQQLSLLRADLDKLRQVLHNSEKQLEAAQAEGRAQREMATELRQRLMHTQQELQEERERVSVLKAELSQEGKKAKAAEVAEQETRLQLQDMKASLSQAADKHDALQHQLSQLNRAYTQLQTEQAEREASHAREVANFTAQKHSLAEQFKVLSNDILEAKTKSLQESSKLSLSAVMSPFQQSIDSFKKEVQEIHHRETSQQGELRKELASLKELNQKITTEAHELSTALRGQKKLQGNWGELVLENVLDRSGLQLGTDYKREVSFSTSEGRQRPDAVVYLPQGKHLIIDAKVSLNAYTRYVNSVDDIERAQALKEHVSAVASRIKELADRDYYKLPGLNSPEMVFMFIPIESAFVEALKADESLFQQAIENNVLVATPTTLLTSLNIVRQLWRYEDQNKHTAALASKAEAVFKKLNTFLSSFEKIKKGLDTATEAYSTAENQLVSGKGNLVKQVGEFKNLAPAIKAELPSYFVEKAALEIDFITPDTSDEAAQSTLLRDDTVVEFSNS
ncbi:DNA recombination protein RmuC [Rheinheimera sp. UJ51]|uniref:DNA recombination protein RmuC n=1 Tax=Rheinheimera sp. UJ51 TaxID=2892446 RepID=UPI001E37253A|nr:DNA recombination protein RmuC [Rheinheimera sp. UJ51]MCC5451214.1 DNA recombination protein RmuC [Rheinheimera sp. UJ51]